MKRGYIIGAVVVVVLVVMALFVPSYLAKQGVDRLVASLPPGESFTYQSANYDLPAMTIVLKGGVFHAPDPALDFEIAEIRIKNGNPGLDKAIADAQAAPDANSQTATEIADRITLTGVHTTYAPFDIKLNSLEIDAPKLILPALYAPLPDLKTPETPGPYDQVPGYAHLRDMVQKGAKSSLATSYDHVVLGGLDMTVNNSTPNFTIKAGIGKMVADGVHAGRVGAVDLDDFSVTVQNVTVSMGRIHADGADEGKLLADLRDGAPIEVALNDTPGVHETIGNIAFKKGGDTLGSIASLTINNLGYHQGMPISADMAFTSLSIDPARLPIPGGSASVLTDLGYKPALFDGAVSYKWDQAAQTIDITKSSLTLQQGGTLSLEASFAGAAPGATMQTIKIASATLHYQDQSLATRWLDYVSKQTGRDVTSIKAGYAAWLARQKPNFEQDKPLSAAIDAAEQFVQDPKAMTIILKPAAPVGITDFDAQHPETFSTKVGLAVTAQ